MCPSFFHLKPELDQAALIQNILARENGVYGSFQPMSDQMLVHSRIEQRQKLFVLCGRPRSSGWARAGLHFPFALGRSTRSSRNSVGPLVSRRLRSARSSSGAAGSIIFSIAFVASSLARTARAADGCLAFVF